MPRAAMPTVDLPEKVTMTSEANARRRPHWARILVLGATLVAALCAPVGAARAQVNMETPVYNEETKSYFALVAVGQPKDIASPTHNWSMMNRVAMSLSYKGVGGRMAKVPSKSVNDFLARHFSPQIRAWIGLRYFCNYNISLWNDGTTLRKEDYQNWSPRWNATAGVNCAGRDGYFPVFYYGKDQGFQWAVQGLKKHYNEMFVEFVTNEE